MPPEVQLIPARRSLPERREVAFLIKDQMTDASSIKANESRDAELSASVDEESPKADNVAVVPDHDTPSEKEDLVPFEDIDEDDEVFEAALTQSQYSSLGRSVFDREKKVGRLKTRSQQAVLHHTFTTMRIEDLERELKQLKSYVYKLEEDLEPTQKEKFPVHRHELERLGANQFRVTGESVKVHWTQQAALEIQLPERAVPSTIGLGTPVDLREKVSEGEHHLSSRMPSNEPRTPERLRVRSHSLMYHLQDITGSEVLGLADKSLIDGERLYGGVVFLRPFKLFVRNEGLIRESLETLQNKVETQTAKKNIPKSVDSKSEKVQQQEYEDTDLLKDLDLFVRHVLDVDLKPTFELRRKLDEGTAVDIEYGDLWHLFSRGDIVIFQSDQSQARRVVNLAGGREPLSYRFEDEYEKVVRVDGFAIDCLSLHTNGSD